MKRLRSVERSQRLDRFMMRASSTWDIPLLPLVRTGSRAIGKKKTMKKKDGGKTRDEEKGSNVWSGALNRVIRGGSFDGNNEIARLGVRQCLCYYREFPARELKLTSFLASSIFNYRKMYSGTATNKRRDFRLFLLDRISRSFIVIVISLIHCRVILISLSKFHGPFAFRS